MRRRGAFTLIEVLAVVFLTAIVLAAAIGFYVNLSRASQAATDHVRTSRRAVAVLDRVARDLESAMLVVKPAEVDPIAHPWLFLAERRGDGPGADAFKFTMVGHRPRGSDAAESDLAVVAYVTRPGEDGLELWRWSSPRLPEQRDRELPRPEDEGSALLADGLAAFGVRWLDEAGVWSDDWDSSQIDRSSQLPLAAEIAVAMAPPPERADDPALQGAEPEVQRLQVLLPLRPLDLGKLLGGEAAGEETAGDGEEGEEDGDDEDCISVAQCIGANRAAADAEYGADFVNSLLQNAGSMCVSQSPFPVPAGWVGCQ